VTRLVLIRHAEPEESARGRCYGSLDVELSPAGRVEAAALGKALAGAGVTAVYASPRRRATQTAGALGLRVQVDDRLRELDFGAFEGRTYAEIEAEHPEVFRQWMTAPTTVRFPGGESFALLRERVLEIVEEIRERHADGTVAVVSHGGVVRAVLADCLAMPAEAIFRLDVAYASVGVVDWIDDTPLVRVVNGRGHDLAYL
jgi:alpha-ribazole phosphatase